MSRVTKNRLGTMRSTGDCLSNAKDTDSVILSMPNRQPQRFAQRLEVYSAAYKLAWRQIPSAERLARPDISLRVHASIRRQLKAGAADAHTIAFTALKDVLVPDTRF